MNTRLDKFICDSTGLTRSEAKKAIAKGRVSVNGVCIKKAEEKIDDSIDKVSLDNKEISYDKYVYYMLNKPAGVVSATTDNIDITVIDLFKNEKKKNLSCVGRLDKDTTGLLIVTNDGEMIHKLTSPRKHVFKDYLVTLQKPITIEAVSRLEAGVDIGDDEPTKPAFVNVTDERCIILSISEGRFHQVKRMLKAVDNEVTALHRLSVGPLRLDNDLGVGKYRKLTDEEIKDLKLC